MVKLVSVFRDTVLNLNRDECNEVKSVGFHCLSSVLEVIVG